MKFLRLIRFLIFLWAICHLASCASSGSLEGGPRDVDPPKLLEEKSTPNFQTLYSDRAFSLTFDEFIVLKDPIKQIVVSPPLTYIPKTSVRSKTLFFSFNEKEVIRENTTYTVNFGEAIQDLHENNKLVNFRFVFSTGEIIDSLAIKGSVIDAASQKPASNATVLLYDNLEDSAFIKEKPFYFARTDKEGVFKIENIKSDTFRIFAITDENISYTYNEGSEALAYRDSLIFPEDLDSTKTISLSLTNPLARLRVFDVLSKQFGKSVVKFNRAVDQPFPVSFTDNQLKYYSSFAGDSLSIWYQGDIAPKDSFEIFLSFDTLKVIVPDTSKKIAAFLPRFVSGSNTLYGNDTIRIQFNHPVGGFDPSKLSVTDSSKVVLSDVLYLFDTLSLKIPAAQFYAGEFRIFAPANTFTDIFGQSFADSLHLKIQIPGEDKLSGLVVNLTGLDSTSQYIIYLMENNNTITSFTLKDISSAQKTFNKLRPGEYRLEIVEDKNLNGVRDQADFWLRRQAEVVKSFPIEKLRENWTIEADINFKE